MAAAVVDPNASAPARYGSALPRATSWEFPKEASSSSSSNDSDSSPSQGSLYEAELAETWLNERWAGFREACRPGYTEQDIVREAACAAAQEGHVEVLSCLYKRDPYKPRQPAWWLPATCAAGKAGQLATLQWMSATEHTISGQLTQIMAAAASEGHINVMEYVSTFASNGWFPWDISASTAAARNGQMKAFVWLRFLNPPCEVGCETYTAAAIAGHVELLHYIAKNKPRATQDYRTALFRAAQYGHLEVLKALLKMHRRFIPAYGLEWIQWVNVSAQRKHAHIVDYLLKEVPANMPGRQDMVAALYTINDCPTRVSLPLLAKLADHGLQLQGTALKRLRLYRRRCCATRGLIRWCEKGLNRPSRLQNGCRWGCTPQKSLLYAIASLPGDVVDKVLDHAGFGDVPVENCELEIRYHL